MNVATMRPATAERGAFAHQEESGYEVGAYRSTEGAPEQPPEKKKRDDCFLRPLDIPLGTEVYDRDGNLVGVADGTGTWFDKVCGNDGGNLLGSTELVFVRQPSPEALRDQARKQLRIPSLNPRTSPSSTTYVNADTWLWIDGADWQPASATASVPGVSVTVTATPMRVVWDMGDGTKAIVCNGPGKPYAPGEDPPCAHVYTRSSAEQPGEAYSVTVTVTWAVSWSVSGAPGGGALDAPEIAGPPVPIRVAEIQTERPTGGMPR